jgi:DNA-binding response OmpR family regulator
MPGGMAGAWKGRHVQLQGLRQRAPLPTDPGTARRVKRVLVAEDEPDISDALRQALTERLDVECDIVANGALVMDSVTARRPDLLILDVALPGLNGLDVFDLLRSDPRLSGLPVLFLTGLPERAETASAGSGVHEVIAKPFDIEDLIARALRLMADVKNEVAA